MIVFRKRKGSLVFLVVIVFVILSIFSMAAISAAQGQIKLDRVYESRADGVHYAEAGVQEVLWNLNKNLNLSIQFNTDIAHNDGFYRLEKLEGDVNSGYVKIKSIGYTASGVQSKRSIVAKLTRRTFTQHVWLTDSEGTAWTATGHIWNGPFHTNGNLRIWGAPVFNGRVTHGKPIQTSTSSPYTVLNPQYNLGAPTSPITYDFPLSNSQLKDRAIANGHYYKGMTLINLNGDGTYDVRTFNPTATTWTYNGVVENLSANTWYYNNVAYQNDAKHSTAPSRKLPANGVIYVDGTQTTQWDRRTGDVYVSGQLKGELTIASANNVYITSYDPTDLREPVYNATTNPVYTPRGVVTNGLTYLNNSTDILGIIAEKSIVILSRGWPRINGNNNTNNYYNYSDIAKPNLKMYGAFFALNGSVSYNYNISGDKGTVELYGSLVQKTREAWRSGNNGYNRSFYHDPKMETKTPPFFLEPTNAGWEITDWKEVSN